jgi:hypothetical protein
MSSIRELLLQARDFLPIQLPLNPELSVARWEDFYVFLAQEEWGLALETLEEIANNTVPALAFWRIMVQAAALLHCVDLVDRYKGYAT